ncbi:MAG: DNA topoisomerase 3 [Selenomonas sp.]|uniref:DNA topoisomerase III n=1 Tax=Selenomonas sp. TaxID=2053611 RepID=UPI0025EA6C21|nr:DNA topoisomerase 3 [Selenomonas sp.]MCI6087177.1 DNA topoisomerase 3 [Selenomonas sp.]
MRLYIAEKPSMGREIAKCLRGPVQRHDGYLTTGDGVVTWLFGHILRQAEPDEYDARYKRWRAEDLPIIPQEWRLYVAKDSAKQFGVVKNLIAKADEIVHAGDPDREGQLLVDEVLDYLGNKKPVQRILLNALDEKSIKAANAHLRPNSDFWNLKQSALARARADWLIGMNLSRAYTLAARRAGHDRIVLPIGRVKTPTLALVVRREREIENFQPVDYYHLRATFEHANGSFVAEWKPKDTMAGLDSENRLVDKAVAEAKLRELSEAPRTGRLTGYQKQKKQEPAPLPFSLSSLQVLAGKRYGYEPQLVLDTAQKLYEKKLTTYPRSDCEYLPTNQFGDAKTILANLKAATDTPLAAWAAGADAGRKSRAWNDKKISAHHAIIPTTVRVNPETLPATERNLYELIARGYIAQFYPPHVYDQTKVEVTYKDELFTAGGRTERDPGWKVMYQSKKKAATAANPDDDGNGDESDSDKRGEDENDALPVMKKGDAVEYTQGELKASVTKPPTRFTPATLLAGMKEIHKYVKNPEAKKQLKDVYGIGTEATRATIIDDLIKRKFLHPQGKKKYLIPTPSAYLLVDALPDEMTYPDSTAIWEDRLHSMSEGDGTLDDFLAAQIAFTRKLCEKAWGVKMEVKGDYICPRCKQGVLVQRKGKNGVFWGCSNYPKCRLTTNDKDGKPDMDEANNRAGGGSLGGGTQSASAMARGAGGGRSAFAPTQVAYADDRADNQPTAADWDELNTLFGPPEPYVPKQWHNWNDKPKYSASPMEKMGEETEHDTADAQIACPHCQKGHLRKLRGKNGVFWGCSNYPRCTATFDDAGGKPVLT